ncbi:unnamed protein product [Adineta steineri]|uniref:G-protein coupled receptors family 1 profile domain-containing protein n=2 Tax=Adineta steineri TaxID=433720 RepID=A0A819HVY4_9BILA|nr:unnamed protein product [Adineta steineri]
MTISYSIRFWLLLIPLIPSIIVSIFNLYHLLRSRTLRTALNNHVIILLLICGLFAELTTFVLLIHLYRTGTVPSATREFCLAWCLVNLFGVISVSLLMAWASIERHILIFHSRWFATKTKLLFFHFLPLAICILWPVAFYLVFYLARPCDSPPDYTAPVCNLYLCLFLSPKIGLFDSIAHYIMPTFIVVLFSIALLIRVLYHKYRMRQRIEWRNYKKMAAQLLPISALYLLISFPPMILYAAYSAGLPSYVAADYFLDGSFFFYWVIIFTPFASVLSLPELKVKCKNIFLFWQRNRVVRPDILPMNRLQAGQT